MIIRPGASDGGRENCSGDGVSLRAGVGVVVARLLDSLRSKVAVTVAVGVMLACAVAVYYVVCRLPHLCRLWLQVVLTDLH